MNRNEKIHKNREIHLENRKQCETQLRISGLALIVMSILTALAVTILTQPIIMMPMIVATFACLADFVGWLASKKAVHTSIEITTAQLQEDDEKADDLKNKREQLNKSIQVTDRVRNGLVLAVLVTALTAIYFI